MEAPGRHPGDTQGHQGDIQDHPGTHKRHPGGTPGAPRRHPTRKTRKCSGPPKPMEAKISIEKNIMPIVFGSLQNWIFEKHPEGTQETPQEHPGVAIN